MRAAFIWALSSVVFLSGCDRLSEKDRMEMIARCDSEARKKLQEESITDLHGSGSITVETHYSFEEKKCYALSRTQYSIERNDYRKQPAQIIYIYSLYDGLTKKELLRASCLKRRAEIEFPKTPSIENGCVEGRVCSGYNDKNCVAFVSGGAATGLLEKQAKKKDGEVITFKEGTEIINARMSRP